MVADRGALAAGVAAHVMMLLGRHSRLIFDGWTRPTWARLDGRKASDAAIERRLCRYGS